MSLVSEVLAGSLRGGTSIVYAGTGESFSESAGVVNLGTEGSMLTGALAAYAVAYETGNVWVGVGAGALAGGALAMVHAFFVLNRRSNQLATGLIVLFLGLGLTSLFGASYVSKDAPSIARWAIPGLSDIPFIGPILFDQDMLTYLSIAMLPVAWWLIYRSRWGLLLRGAGERSEVLAANGHPVLLVQYLAVVGGGMLAGIGGAHLSVAYANQWSENMVQGRGFVACAVVIFAARQPFKVAAGAWLYGGALALSPALQARWYGINQFALASIPYVAIVLVLIALGKKRSAEAPEGLKKVFEMAPSG